MRNCLIAILLAIAPPASEGYANGKAGFSIEINGETNPYSIYSAFVMPGEVLFVKGQLNLRLQSENLAIYPYELGWKVVASETPGTSKVLIEDPDQNQMTVNILVLTPLSKKEGEYLNRYRIGTYPSTPLRGNPIYNKPEGLFEVTASNEDLRLTPHFTIKQFLCKQSGDYPKYLIVRERLLLKLEYLLEKVNEKGFDSETFGFISGYRTPYYNASIRNVTYSRHVWGGAADIMIDNDGNGGMDDMNNDGKIDKADVQLLYDIVESEFDKPSYRLYKGGLGFYKRNGRHNGFIHVDVRGTRARW